MPRRKYTDEQLIEAWNSSSDVAEVLRKIGLVPRGGNYAGVKRHAAQLGLSEDSLSPLDKVINPSLKRVNLSDSLILGTKVDNQRLLQKLFSLGIFERMCCVCGIVKFHGVDVPLELEHINGNPFDNRLENLTVLCTNCHSQTDTYTGKNVKNR